MNAYPQVDAVPLSSLIADLDSPPMAAYIAGQALTDTPGWVSPPFYEDVNPGTIYQWYLERVQRYGVIRVVRESDPHHVFERIYGWNGAQQGPYCYIGKNPSGPDQVDLAQFQIVRDISFPHGDIWSAVHFTQDYQSPGSNYFSDFPGYFNALTEVNSLALNGRFVFPLNASYEEGIGLTVGEPEGALELLVTIPNVTHLGQYLHWVPEWIPVEYCENPFGGYLFCLIYPYDEPSDWRIYAYTRRIQFSYLCSRPHISSGGDQLGMTNLIALGLMGGLTFCRECEKL